MSSASSPALPRPQDDLFRHVNGKWLETTEIPSDRAAWGAFNELRDASEKRCRDIIEACEADAEDENGLMARLYAAFMDTAAIEERGLGDITADLARVDDARTKGDLAELLGDLERDGVGGWVALVVGIDPEEPELTCPALYPAGISLPDEVYYHANAHEHTRQRFLAHVTNMFRLAGITDAATQAARVFEVERGFARFHVDSVRSRDVDLTINLTTYPDVAAEASGFAWQRWAQALGADLERINVAWPSFVVAGARWWSLLPIDVLKSWLRYRILDRYSSYLPAAFVEEAFDFYSRTLAGVDQLRDRWKRGVDVVESHLGFALGRRYVERHFPASSRDQMETLVANLLEAYARSITELTWMSDATRERALAKLAKFRTKIAYPTRSRTYEDVVFASDASLIDMVRSSSRAATDHELAKIGGAVDREEWHMTPQTVNAYYSPLGNEIVFPAAILEEPFFSPEASDPCNYGGIGAVIGHEIGHGFDDQGAKFDGDGKVENWWEDGDFAEFTERTRALISQYDAYVPAGLNPDEHVNGALTIGENIGDLGGLSIALKAWHIAREKAGLAAPEADDVREFFIQWARIWRGKVRPEMRRQLLVVDPHSPDEFRCNGVVRNVDAFHEVFSTTPGDDLWLDPDQRVTIW
ncbi:M13 family metallopeptidase [Nanchangia anserum]|uniref:Peptidase M13 n=1 Tax=Nanchangia anserum TaxID=2692125 RepID=A0A8I0KTR6_9ACTO|nr:M13-type metalloendopeptidase [Nanchangia anserum]MBD3688883.1 peptidase M13 [Nanchangia anserum]